MPDPDSESIHVGPDISPPDVSIDDSQLRTSQTAQGDGNVLAASSGDGSPIQIVNVHPYRHDHEGESEQAIRLPDVIFEVWQRKSRSCRGVDGEFGERIALGNERLDADNLVLVETRLPSLAEDVFQQLSTLGGYSDCQFDIAFSFRTPDDASNGLNLNAIIAALPKLEGRALFYLDLHSLPVSSREALRDQLFSDGAWFARNLKRANAFCVAAVPASLSVSTPSPNRAIALSFEDEETILVNRASVDGGQLQTIVAEKVRQQITHSMWGEPVERLYLLDEAIRTGKVAKKIEEYARQVSEVATQSKKFESRLGYLLGMQEDDSALEERYKRLQQMRSEAVRSALCERALFILTSFDLLTPSEFDFLMRALLAGQSATERVEKEEWVVTTGSSGERGAADIAPQPLQRKTELIDQEILLLPVYEAHSDRLLALLDVGAQESGFLAFEPAFKTQVARRYFRAHRPILHERLLVHHVAASSIQLDVPIHLAEQLAERYAEHVARLAPPGQKIFVARWMDLLARQCMERQLPISGKREDAKRPPLKQLLEAVGNQSSRESARNLSRLFASHACLLFTRLLANPTTKDLVDQALDWLTQQGEDAGGTHDLIFAFVRILRRYKDFDTLRWLKRLLSQGNDDTKRSALDFLAGGIELGSDTERSNILETLRLWVPAGEQASVLNNQTAALLAPRVAMHRAFARRRDREHGAIDQLLPLFDLSHEDGLSPESSTAIKLLTNQTGGSWIRIDLDLLDQLVDDRWGVTSAPAPSGASNEKLFLALSMLDSELETGHWNDAATQSLVLTGLLVESIAVVLGSPETAEISRAATMRTALQKIAQLLDRKTTFSLYKRAYDISTKLGGFAPPAAKRRARCARWLGDVLYECHKQSTFVQ